MSKSIKKLSDYGITKDTKDKLIHLAGRINKTLEAHGDMGMRIGEEIAAAHELLAGEGREGAFAAWVRESLKISRQTAYNYMWGWQKFGKCKTILHFSDSTAIYALASPSVPDSARKEAEKMADSGQKVTLEVAKKLKKKHSPPPKDRSPRANTPATAPVAPPEPVAQAAPPPEPEEPADKTEVGKKLKKINDLIGQTIRTCDEVRSHMTAREYDAIYSSLDIACRELTSCRARWRKMKVVG